MKRVSFCEETQVYDPIMDGQVHWIQKKPLASEEKCSRDVPVFKHFVEK